MGVNNCNRVEHFSSSSHETSIRVSTTTTISMEIHSVCLPPKQTTLQKLNHKLTEIFFPDDPLYRFKNQTWCKKLLLALQFLCPIFQWGPEYNLRLLRSDVISGLTIASLAIPQGISYAKLANLPPIIGLYSSFVPPLIYSILGSSRHLAVGPVSIASLVMGSMLSEAVSFTEDPILYLKLAFTATFFAGLFQASLGLLRILRWVREEEEHIKTNNENALKCVILDMTAVTAIDTSGIEMVCELQKMMSKRSLQIVLANPAGSVMEKLQKSKILESFESNGLYITVGEAVADITSSWKAQP
ncbi:hypothetical protein HS088_TW22G00581 [Tripterygium wilfordii]|uniref:STAS domain-containing protein n=1 Tax=Tripterygium wilfordii TaxID=458696 RepID=A0A7J7BZF2_TRIWF|nr:hypothetical protein HS088_TW22G00581 [Tripterygium wilfordii]